MCCIKDYISNYNCIDDKSEERLLELFLQLAKSPYLVTNVKLFEKKKEEVKQEVIKEVNDNEEPNRSKNKTDHKGNS